MWQKFCGFCFKVRQEFFYYFLVGASGTILDLGTLALFKEIFGWRPVVAVIINQIIIINYVFFLNKFFTFSVKGKTFKRLRNFIMLTLWNYVFSIAWMYVLNEMWGYNYLVVRIANIILAVSWNFLLYKFWIYPPLKD